MKIAWLSVLSARNDEWTTLFYTKHELHTQISSDNLTAHPSVDKVAITVGEVKRPSVYRQVCRHPAG